MASGKRGLPAGVQRKHSRRCPAYIDKAARCRGKGCSYQVQAGPRAARQTRTFKTVDAGVTWKRDVERAVAKGLVSRERSRTLRAAAEQWEQDARASVALARGRKRYRTATIDEYVRLLDQGLLDWVNPDEQPGKPLGDLRLDQVDAGRLDDLIATFQRGGAAASTVRNRMMPLRAVYRHAVKRKWVGVNPTIGLEVPTGSGRRMRVIPAGEILAFIRALPVEDRALWATAFYTGLRRGELMALRWEDVDLANGWIHVHPEHGAFDTKTRTIGPPKSEAGGRKVPINGELRELLVEQRARCGRRAHGFVFRRGALAGMCKPGTENEPFLGTTINNRAARAWTAAGLAPVTMHDCRHTFASLAIAAMAARGVSNPKLLQKIMGHSSIQVTYDRYGHLFDDAEAELGRMLDEFIGGAARPPVTEAIDQLRDALEQADQDLVRPEVTEAVSMLQAWLGGCEDSVRAECPVDAADRAVIVQRGSIGRLS